MCLHLCLICLQKEKSLKADAQDDHLEQQGSLEYWKIEQIVVKHFILGEYHYGED
jgi:hypothetical protein